MPSIQLAPVHTKLLKTWTSIAQSAVAVTLTGSVAETVLKRISFAAGALGPNGVLKITNLWSVTNNANNKTLYARLGAAGIVAGGGTPFNQAALTTQVTFQHFILIRNRNNQAIQVGQSLSNQGTGGAGALPNLVTGTVDTSAAFDLIICGQLASAGDTLTLESCMVELLYGA